MAMGAGAFKIVLVVAVIAIAGGMITSQALDVPALFGNSHADGPGDADISGTTADETPKEETVPSEQSSGTTDVPGETPQVVPVSTHVDISGMTEITDVTTIDVSGSYYIDGRNIAADSGVAIGVAASDVLIVIKGDCTVTSEDDDAIRVSSTSKLTIQGYDSDSTLTVEGATDSGMGSGIGNTFLVNDYPVDSGDISIVDLNGLTSTANGKWGCAIGGDGATVEITNTHIVSAIGGRLQTIDGTYLGKHVDSQGKNDVPGGPGIGGSVITITDSTIDLVVGGCKSAGIGARYWQATSITITNSAISEVYGGSGSAGIGGSREAHPDPTWQTVTIVISDSTISAFGGENAAGIGSGYDVNCQVTQGEVHIEISGDSVISAQGGKYAAGIGTGYHYGNLTGFITASVDISNVHAGQQKGSYSVAQDIGYGVIQIEYNGTPREGTYVVEHGVSFTVGGAAISGPQWY